MKSVKIAAIIAAGLLFFGCSSSDSSTSTTPDTPVASGKLQLIDAPIEGVTYTCADGQSYVTDDQGGVECEGFPITFKIGNIIVGELTAEGPDLFVTPQDLLGIARSQLDDETLMRLIVFLQSLDNDGSYADYISIPLAYREKLAQYEEKQFIDLNASELASLYLDLNVTTVSEADAMNHLIGSLWSRIDTCNFISDHNVTVAMNTRATIFINGLAQTSAPSVTQPPNGASSIYTVANEFINAYYTPDVNYTGQDHFTFTIDECTKNINVTVLGEAAPEPAAKDFAAVYFPDESGVCRAMVTDGNVTNIGTKAVEPYLCDHNGGLYGEFSNFFYKVNGRFVYDQDEGSPGVADDRLYAINSSGTQTWLNEDDISGTKTPYDQCPGHDTYMHQIQVLLGNGYLSNSLLLKKRRPGERERLIYTALSPEDISSPDGMAAGQLPWLTEGYKKEIIYGDPTYIVTAPPGECIMSYYHGFEGTFLMNDIAADGVGGDRVITPYVEMDDFVYYLTYYDGEVRLDRFDPAWSRSLTMSFIYGLGTDWSSIVAHTPGLYDSFSYTTSIATDNSGLNAKNYMYFYYESSNTGNTLVRSDSTAENTTVISTKFNQLSFQKIHTLLGWDSVISNIVPGAMPVLVPHYKDTVFYNGYNTESGKQEIGKINDDGTLTRLIDNVPFGDWIVQGLTDIYFGGFNEGDSFYHYDGTNTTAVTLGLMSFSNSTGYHYSELKSMKKIGDRIFIITQNNQSSGHNLLLLDRDTDTYKVIESGFTYVPSSSNIEGDKQVVVFPFSTAADTILYATVDGNASAGYEHKLYEYNALSGVKTLIKDATIPGV
ncbi:MAG: hypothetical protein PF439_07145 [Helicobacteraceae bacterium]|jgi:hypothetical protein|nr:hypothetical protein [Helicobacteraceae bacterium]